MTLTAQCSNCAAWRTTPDQGHATAAGVGFCGRNLAPPPGEVLCQSYEASARFRQDIISAMLKEEGPMALPVKLVGGRKSAKEFKQRGRR